ncbi:MAG: hydrogenase 4 subunit B [Thiogranum sp.]|nr:hydrogenase 4 subunit B [Thiogranum sp.]
MAIDFALAAVLAALGSSLVSTAAHKVPSVLRYLAFPLLAVSGAAATVAGFMVMGNGEVLVTTLPVGLPWLEWQIRVDVLSALFLTIIGIVTFAVAIFGPGYVREYEHGQHPLAQLGIFTGLFITGMLLVVMANDAFLFMIAWELMSLSSYFLVMFHHEQAANRRAGFLYLLMAHVGGLAILLGYGVLATFGDGFSFDAMRAAPLTPLWASVAFALTFVGFGMKAGLVPLHAWLPEAHPVAPSHISALMSGVMLKVAIYGFIRVTLDLIGDVHWGWGVVALLIGSISALLGVLYALQQNDLKRLLAYSSIENIGIIFLALGMALVFLGTGLPKLGAIALVAALFHTFNHAIFKSLLFLGAGNIVQRTHEQNLERMGGLLTRLPYTGFFFLIGCMSIAALPPFNGFASEWLTFQAALQAAELKNGVLRALIPFTAAMLALTGALALACFVKAYGVAFLGQPRSRRVRHARKTAYGMRFAQGLLATICVLAGVFPNVVVNLLDTIPRMLTGTGLQSATTQGWLWLTPVAPGVASYSAPLVLVGILVTWLIAWWFSHPRGARSVRRGPAWDCGFGPLGPTMQYTSTSFAMPIRRIFAPVWGIEEKIERQVDEYGLRVSRLSHQQRVYDRSWAALYEPIARWVQFAARRVSRLQQGNIRVYIAYSFFTLLLLLWVIS